MVKLILKLTLELDEDSLEFYFPKLGPKLCKRIEKLLKRHLRLCETQMKSTGRITCDNFRYQVCQIFDDFALKVDKMKIFSRNLIVLISLNKVL